jgi:hypothetical protein
VTRSDLADIPMTWSALKEMSRSPAHCRCKALQPDAGEQTLAMRMGSGVHALTFGTPAVHVYNGAVRRGKEWDAFRAAVEDASGPDAIILNVREHSIAAGMAEALRNDPIANPILFGPGVEREQPMAWTVGGRAYRTRGVDFRNRRKKYIGELKQARTCQPGKFERDQLRALYPAQVELYDEGDAILTGRDRDADPFDKFIIAVEPTAPYVVTVYQLTPSAIRDARKKIGLYRSMLATCEASNAFPGYSLSVVPFEVEESAWDSVDEDELADDAGPMESATWTTDGAEQPIF